MFCNVMRTLIIQVSVGSAHTTFQTFNTHVQMHALTTVWPNIGLLLRYFLREQGE